MRSIQGNLHLLFLLPILHVLVFGFKHSVGCKALEALPGAHQFSCFEETNGREEEHNPTALWIEPAM